jgi:hypothetical protein
VPLSLDLVRNIHRTIEIPIAGETLNVTYNLSAFAKPLSDWLDEHGDDKNYIAGFLERVVVSWDFVNGGIPIPATVEAMEQYLIPRPILRIVYDKILEDSNAKNLSESFSTGLALVSDVRRNGTR